MCRWIAYLLGVGDALITKGALPVGGRPLHFGRLTAATSAKCGWLGRIIFGSRGCAISFEHCYSKFVENQPQNCPFPFLNSTVTSVLTNQPRLPKLTLESFSGKDISSFTSFWARFKSAVHENSSLNDVDKFSYLKSVVTSDAELAIRGLTLTSENYAKAIKILEDRFGRKELIVDFHMNRLLNLTPVRKSVDVIALRNLYDQLEINIRGLESLEISPDSYNSSLVAVETSLGWSLQGRCDEQSDCTSVHLVHSEQESISAELRRFWEIENLGILDKDSVTLGNGDEEILELLLCFRKSSIAFTADVKSAFLQIELDLRDRDFTRFFWTDNLNNEPYVLNFTRVLFGLRPSPYLLAATLKHHFKKYKEQYPHTFELLNSSIYVDDLICGQNNVPDALRTTLECLQIFSDAGMLLRKWQTNSKQLDLLWQQEDVETESSETSAIDLRPPTKRRIEKIFLSVVGRIFDPIGILGPFVIKLKCLLQELWTLGVEWDSELPQSYDTSGSSGVAKLRARLR
ncbi:integrase catalytic domain-containing protein [Trichonephila inaurata madagascariensis]|uniref:Integrase catalytic domain-containing protein n=1 Tax=Trichonephila inaurata madagascariensis TaxID=2747483 RepID=A0A8X7C9T2_9ARAC|nr:integrase catalytic domain-containing protein [Trichonephila inaurata madagascariensis]